jgi:hypothetical protein
MQSHDRYVPRFATAGQQSSKYLRQLREKFESMLSSGPQEVNIADWMGKVAFDLIGQAGLGYSFGALEGKNDQFYHAIKEFMCV